MSTSIIKALEKLAERGLLGEQSAGKTPTNAEKDAYWAGVLDGETQLARYLRYIIAQEEQ